MHKIQEFHGLKSKQYTLQTMISMEGQPMVAHGTASGDVCVPDKVWARGKLKLENVSASAGMAMMH